MKSLTTAVSNSLVGVVLLGCLLLTQQGVAQTSSDALFGSWNFDEGAGATAADQSVERNGGSLTGHTWAAGKQNNSVCFSGGNGQTMRAGTVNTPSSMTMSAWVKPSAGQISWRWIAAFGDSAGLFIDEDGALNMYIWGGNAWSNIIRSQSQLGLGAQGLADGAWHHVAGSYEPSGGFRLFVDGKDLGSESAVGSINYAKGSAFHVGSMNGKRNFAGCIDEVQLYSKALSLTEIKTIAGYVNQPQPGQCKDDDGDGWGWDGSQSCQTNVVTAGACIDDNGDGWGWDGVKSCQVNPVVNTGTCIDDNGDGWGWDGVKSCQVNPVTSSGACIDDNGDGWGWDGSKSCQVNVVTAGACIDDNGDGWGWDGVKSCQVGGPTSNGSCIDDNGDGWGWDGTKSCQVNVVTAGACVDDNGDGWGWDGVKSCQVNPVTRAGACIDDNGDGWGWDGVKSCQVQQSGGGNVFINSVDDLALRWGTSPWIADIKNKRLFMSLGEAYAVSKTKSAALSYQHAASGYALTVNGQKINAGSNLSLNIQHGDVLPVTISRGNNVVDQYNLVVTNLPIVQIFAANIVDEPKLPGTMRWVDGARGIDTGTMPLGIEYRGNTAQRFEKKPFSIEVRDENGKGTNVQFLDLRNDDDWILDAAFRDQSFVRNLVSHDMFRDMRSYAYINSAGEKKGQSAIAGGLTELILNSEYHGVFVLHEKVDRKLLKLEKINVPEDASGDRWDLVDFTDPSNGSVLYKASEEQANFQSVFGIETQFEQKYPDDDDINHYQPLRDLGEFIANSSDSDFINRAASLIEFESVVDWWLMRLATSNWDAFHKNYYPARSENLKWTIVPWDFDATFGMDWRGGVDPASVEFYDPARNKLVGRLIANPQTGFNAMAKARWSELRKSIFTADSIAARFAFYAKQVDRGINVSGVSPRQRNSQRWPNTGNTGAGSPQLADIEYLRSWLNKRLAFVDGKIAALAE